MTNKKKIKKERERESKWRRIKEDVVLSEDGLGHEWSNGIKLNNKKIDQYNRIDDIRIEKTIPKLCLVRLHSYTFS